MGCYNTSMNYFKRADALNENSRQCEDKIRQLENDESLLVATLQRTKATEHFMSNKLADLKE